MTKKMSAADTRREVMELLATEGIRAAAEAAIAVCKNPEAPPASRATSSMIIMRATAFGGFGKTGEADDAKEPHEMTADEIARRLALLRRERDDDVAGTVFD